MTHAVSTRQQTGGERASLFILASLDEERSAAAQGSEPLSRDPVWNQRLSEMCEVVTAHGGASSILADGTFVAVFASCGDAVTLSRAAACASALRGVIPQAPMVMGSGSGVEEVAALERLVDTLVEESLRRIVATARAARGDSAFIRLGDGMSDILSKDFEVKRDDIAYYLVPESRVA